MNTYSLASLNNLQVQPVDSSFWGDIRYDANDAAPVYIGMHLMNNVATSATDWKIIKFTYDGNSKVTRMQLAYGAWDNRASLF